MKRSNPARCGGGPEQYVEAASVLQGEADDMAGGAPSGRQPRADAVRNRERLLDAARAVFGNGDASASLEAVARRAGVGIGTLYRHFPTREALFEAIYRNEVERLVELAELLRVEAAPMDALRQWTRANVAFIATKRGMVAALAIAAHSKSHLTAYSTDRLSGALGSLLARAAAAGEIRGDVSAEEFLRAVIGICYMFDKSDWQASVLRIVDVLVDGLKQQPGKAQVASLKREW